MLFVVAGSATAARGQTGSQTGSDERWPAAVPVSVEITLVGPAAALAPVREVTAELLGRDSVAVLWREADKLRAEEIIEAPSARGGALAVVWVDLSSAAEARVYFRAAAGRRFVIRRVALPSGAGPLAAEEIAQIIQSVLRALAADTAWALSLPAARVELGVPERAPAPAGAPAPARAISVEVGSAVVGQTYAPGLPLAGSVDVSLAAVSRPVAPRAGWGGSFGGRLTLGYGWPAHVAAGAVGADLRTVRFRLALVWEPWRRERFSVRLGLGGGADRVTYEPTAELAGATAAAPGTFVSGLACVDATLRLDVSTRVALTTALFADVSLQRVHYDAYDARGNLEEVLVPHRIRPGLAIALEVRL